ncbi:MAG: hexokinase [Selenomonadaceae bacterium]|nr:hexokinase [Selenomonadaceae bacterium]
MRLNKGIVQSAIEEFALSEDELKKVREDFKNEITLPPCPPSEKGALKSIPLRGGRPKGDGSSSLKMLPSFLSTPTGNESGTYLALDFGGTNVRVLKIKLLTKGEYEIVNKVAAPLIKAGEYDFIHKDATGEELFDFIAKLIKEAINGDKGEIRLGHTFSFPSEQLDLANAKLISWTKEFQTRNVEGENVTELLKAALKRANIENVIPVAVINDTVATLLTAAYADPNALIGSIYATGHNTCYLEKNYNGQPMILNLESGGFSKVPRNGFDLILDERSEKRGAQFLEKATSGRYVGELFSIAAAKALESDKLFDFSSVDLCDMITNNSTSHFIKLRTNYAPTPDEAELFAKLANNILTRSALLVTATFLGLYDRIGEENLSIGIDGSLYGKNPFLQEIISGELAKVSDKISAFKVEDGSAIGAAIAAAC